MGYALGIDVGQTSTTAAVARWDEHGELDTAAVPLGEGTLATPTVVHLVEDNQLLVGEAALRHSGLRAQRIEPGAFTQLEEGGADATLLATHDLLALVARWVVDTVAAREGAPADTVVLTHPVSWGQRGEELVRAALAGLGLPEVTLVPGAAAAAVRATTPGPVPVGSTVAVHDLGATTFDTAVVSTSDRGHPAVVRSAAGFERPQGSVTDAALLARTVEVLAGALGAVTVSPSDLGCVLLVGSEAGRPLVADTISRAFGRPVVVDADPMLTTALGAARWGSSLAAARTAIARRAAPAASAAAVTHRRGWSWRRPARAGWVAAGALVVLLATGLAVRAASHDSAQAASPGVTGGRASAGSTGSATPSASGSGASGSGASGAGADVTSAGMPSVSFATPSSAATGSSAARSRGSGIAVDDGTLASARVRVTGPGRSPVNSAADSTLLLPARTTAPPVGIGVATVPVTPSPAPRTSTTSSPAPRAPSTTSPTTVAPQPSRTTPAAPTSAAPVSTSTPPKATTAPAPTTPVPTATAPKTTSAAPTSTTPKATATTPKASATTPKTTAAAPKATATATAVKA